MLVGSCMCVHCARMCGWEALLWLSVSPCVRLGTTVGVWRYASCGHASGCPVGHSAHACVCARALGCACTLMDLTVHAPTGKLHQGKGHAARATGGWQI